MAQLYRESRWAPTSICIAPGARFQYNAKPMERRKVRCQVLLTLILTLILTGRAPAASIESRPGPVYVILWFDTEDYISPLSDDAAKRVALLLDKRGVRATFKIVGEKARTLERRHRFDVIEALSRHEIGYHSDTHSQHPIVAEYESVLDWEDGIDEFTRREKRGFDDVQRILGQTPTCYGQPGSSWSPQSYGALASWGIGVYLDEAPHVGLNGKPFWYGGLLNVFNTKEGPQLRPDDYWHWPLVADAKTKFERFYNTMSNQSEGGIISLYFHPWEFVYREPWDVKTFANGTNPLPQDWKAPPPKSSSEVEAAFNYLDELIAFMKSFSNVKFITASQALVLYRDPARTHSFSFPEVLEIAKQVSPDISFLVGEHFSLSPSEVFAILNRSIADLISKHAFSELRLHTIPYGPALAPVMNDEQTEVSWPVFESTTLDVSNFLAQKKRIPNVVWFAGARVSPESYLVSLADVFRTYAKLHEFPARVKVAPARLASSRYVADDAEGLWGFVFPRHFRAPNMMTLAKLQAWTLKPAKLASTPSSTSPKTHFLRSSGHS
jgi:peptidoglycan/xylan/chitin deacetylase (PgdA/CDA1 family)